MEPQTNRGRKIRNRVIWTGFFMAITIMTGVLYYAVHTTQAHVRGLQNNRIQVRMQYDTAVLKTNYGNITIEFLTEKAPRTVRNFTDLAARDFYDDTKFHRVIEGFMIQGGDPLSKDPELKARWGTGGPGYMIESEINDQPLVRGVVAMANSGLDTGGSQFFIITAEATPWLKGKHTAFAKVVDGLDVVMEIQSVETGPRDIPLEPVTVTNIELD